VFWRQLSVVCREHVLLFFFFFVFDLCSLCVNLHGKVYFSLFPTRYTFLFRLRTISAIFFPLHVSGLTGPSSGGLNCACSQWYSPPENGIVYRNYIKIFLLLCRLSYRLLGIFCIFLGIEMCRGKRIADIICRRKRKVYQVGNKEK